MKTQALKLAIGPVLLMTLIACSADRADHTVATPEPSSSTAPSGQPAPATAAPEATEAPSGPAVTAGQIEHYENIALTDWLDEDTVVVSKENENLAKMSLAELADSYPKSLYLYHLDTKEYELLTEQEDVFLGEAVLSPDKRFVLYSEYTLGDPAYYVMDLGSKKTFGITGEPIGGAQSARWADDNTVIGPAYSGGAFTANTSGKIAAVQGLGGEGLIIVRQIKDKVYYTTTSNETLQTLDLTNRQKASLELDRVGNVIPSPDGDQLLVQQYTDSGQTLLLSGTDGSDPQVLAEGAGLSGVSWSPDQRMIAYSVAADDSGTAPNTLFIYDLASGESIKIAEGTSNLTTSWSPSGKALSYTEWDGSRNNSSVVELTF